MMRTGGISPQTAGTTTSNAMTTSVVEKIRDVSLVGDNRACSNGGSGKDRCSNDTSSVESRGTQRNPYTMDVDRRENKNCYNCGGFRYLARNYKNRRIENKIGEGKRLEYGRNERQERMEGENGENLNGE